MWKFFPPQAAFRSPLALVSDSRLRRNPRRLAVDSSKPFGFPHGGHGYRGGRRRTAAAAVQAGPEERAARGGAPRRAPPRAPRRRHGGDLRHGVAPRGLGPYSSPLQDRRKLHAAPLSIPFFQQKGPAWPALLASAAICSALLDLIRRSCSAD